jgi:uncharacterized protein YciI
MKKSFAVLFVLFLCSPVIPQEAQKKTGKQQFIIVLKLIPRLLDEKNWTERENQIVAQHFRKLQQLLKEGKLILAGRTLTTDPKQMGIIILEVDSGEEARQIMENDDAVKEKVMTAELFPFKVALSK